MTHVTSGLLGNSVACIALAVLTLGSAGAQTDGVAFFETNVRPLFVQRCLGCHAAVDHPAGSLRLDNRESLLQGGSRGPAIVPGKPEESLLIRAVRQTSSSLRMPPAGKLSDAEIATLAQWIAMGAPWPGNSTPEPAKAHRSSGPLHHPKILQSPR